IVDQVAASSRRGEGSGGDAIETPQPIVTKQALERGAQCFGGYIAEAPPSVQQRSEPLVRTLEQHRIVERGDFRIERMREGGAMAQLAAMFVPRQLVEPMLAHAVQQCQFDRALLRPWIGSAREPDRAEATA